MVSTAEYSLKVYFLKADDYLSAFFMSKYFTLKKGRLMTINVSQLFYYPVKSLPGINAQNMKVNSWGPHHDRRLMLVDGEGRMITQRQCRLMALIKVRDLGDSLQLEFRGLSISIAWPNFNKEVNRKIVSVWNDEIEAQIIPGSINTWLSDVLQRPVQLVYMSENTHRQVDLKYAPEVVRTSFSDGFPFLLISMASIAFLQKKLPFDLDVRRFRPNIVVDGCEAFAEDSWSQIRIGEIEFQLVKPCARCVMPSINMETAQIQKEVMQVMNDHRKREGDVFMGKNMVHTGEGELQLGQIIEVVKTS